MRSHFKSFQVGFCVSGFATACGCISTEIAMHTSIISPSFAAFAGTVVGMGAITNGTKNHARQLGAHVKDAAENIATDPLNIIALGIGVPVGATTTSLAWLLTATL